MGTNLLVKALTVSEMIAENEHKEYRCVVQDVAQEDKGTIQFGWMREDEVIRINILDNNIESIQTL